MALESKVGPIVATGNLSPIQNTGWEAGPSLFADGAGVVDDRFVSFIGAALPKVYGLNSSDYVAVIDAFPTAPSVTNVVNATGTGTTVGNPLTLAAGTVQSAVTGIPLVPWIQTTDIYGNRFWTPPAFAIGTPVVAGLTLDFGMCTGTTFTSSTVTLSTTTGPGTGVVPVSFAGQTVNKNQIIQLVTTNHVQPEMMFIPGQYIIVANAGNAGGTLPLITQVLAIDYLNHFLYVANPAQAVVTAGGIGNANAFGGNPGIAYWPFQQDGATLLFDPRQGVSRALSYVSSSAGDTAATLTVSGWDVYGVPMTETITLTGTTAVPGKKAFKAIKSIIVGGATLAGNISVGTGTTAANVNGAIGLNLRTDAFSYLSIAVADAFTVTANTGFLKGDVTSPATAATGDPRGTYAFQSAVLNGTTRVFIQINPSQYQWALSTNVTPQMSFGIAQF